ncbi:MAG: galactonate dehydratase [Armatimonas sp.]
MKIDKLELFRVPPRWQFLKITCDDGTFGWGEPVVEGKAASVAACIEEMSDAILGKPAGNIEDVFQTLYRGGFYRGGAVETSAISGIDQALWDIKGKALGVPVYELLGGAVRDKVKVYAHMGGNTPEECAEAARKRLAEGYTALKTGAVGPVEWIDSPAKIDEVVEKLMAIRNAVGRDVSIGIDFHGRVHKGYAKPLVKALEIAAPMFYEEVVLSENNEALRDIATHTSVPLATGERLFTRWGFKNLLKDGVIDIIQPDLSHAGGIWEGRKIAAMAEAFDVAVAPHCPLGPLTLAASLQLDFCTPNAIIQEQSLGIHYHQGEELLDYLTDKGSFVYENGYVLKPTAPGLGIEINEDLVRERAKTPHQWRNPMWHLPDGSLTEW